MLAGTTDVVANGPDTDFVLDCALEGSGITEACRTNCNDQTLKDLEDSDWYLANSQSRPLSSLARNPPQYEEKISKKTRHKKPNNPHPRQRL